MTLGRQLLTGISIAFVVLLFGIEAIYVGSARKSLEQQLDAHANETATSLALSIGSRMSFLDASLANLMVGAVFDRGQFERIEVLAASGERVFGRELGSRESSVPRWFQSLVALNSPQGEALISSGWKQLGKVVVRTYPEYAYRQLFDTALATLLWLTLLFALALAAMRYYLAGILKPLARIEAAAVAISDRNFVSIDFQPRTRELQQVTVAINSLSAKIRAAIAEESGRAEHLRKEAFEDPLTAQLNRRGFEQSVSSLVGERGDIHSGALALFSLGGLVEINAVFGLSRGDEVVKQLGEVLAASGSHGMPIVGRWQGPVLAALLPGSPPEFALAWADGICRTFGEHLRLNGLPTEASVHCGLAHFRSGVMSVGGLAKAAEGALAQASKGGTGVIAVSANKADGPEFDLRKEIETAILSEKFVLLGQKVVSTLDQAVIQTEMLCSLTGGNGLPIPAGTFVPVASQHGLLPQLDIKVIAQALTAMEKLAWLAPAVSVNVSMQSVADAGFRTALRKRLGSRKPSAAALIVEVTGYAASRSPELTREFAAELRKYGVRLALDNFDLDRNSITIVSQMMPAYIKLAPVFTRQIGAREDLRFIVEALLRMLRPLEIPLIAQGVEDSAAIAVLSRLGLSAYQGFAIGRPEPLAFS